MSDQQQFAVGNMVFAAYKSGEYLGEITEVMPSGKRAVRILAVVRHPEQGDLHHGPREDDPVFHTRRALSFREEALVPIFQLKPYNGQVPSYEDSLRKCLAELKHRIEQTEESWKERALSCISELERDYDTSLNE